MTITEQLEKLADDVCDEICKYPERYAESYADKEEALEHMMCEKCENCPLARYIG